MSFLERADTRMPRLVARALRVPVDLEGEHVDLTKFFRTIGHYGRLEFQNWTPKVPALCVIGQDMKENRTIGPYTEGKAVIEIRALFPALQPCSEEIVPPPMPTIGQKATGRLTGVWRYAASIVGDDGESWIGDDDGVPRLTSPVILDHQQVSLGLPTGFQGQGLRLWRTGNDDMRFRFRKWIKGTTTGSFVDGATADATSDDAALDPETMPLRDGVERLFASLKCVLVTNELLKWGGFAQADAALETNQATDTIIREWNLRQIKLTGSYPYKIKTNTRQGAVDVP
jgi:hypothetical protein